MKYAYLFGICLSAFIAQANETVWLSTIQETEQAAQQQQRDVYLLFTGTDWCPACQHLHDNILTSDLFTEWTKDRFIPSQQIMPRKPVATEPNIVELYNLMKKYHVDSFPTAVVCTPDMRPYARIMSSAPSAADYIKRMEDALTVKAQFQNALANAQGKEGLEKARLLDAALKILPAELRPFHDNVIHEIEALDTNDELGYKGAVERDLLLGEQTEAFQKMCESRAGKISPNETNETIAIALAMATDPDLLPVVRQRVLKTLADTYALKGDLPLPERIKTIRNIYMQAIKAAPNTPLAPRMQRWVDHYNDMLKEMTK